MATSILENFTFFSYVNLDQLATYFGNNVILLKSCLTTCRKCSIELPTNCIVFS
jgi:hypothetical protein